MTILFLDKVDAATMGATIFFVIFILLCYSMFGLLSYRFKIVAMTDNALIVIMPFRLQYKNLKFDSIDELNWDLWETFRMGDYRKLIIQTSSGFRTNISDLEFINYDSLEKWLVDRTTLKLNLDRKLNIELRQAKWNRWLNLIAIVMFVFFFFLFSNGQWGNNTGLAIQITMVIITWRLLVRLFKYQKLINESTQN
jgi:hypothetical protein